jgi:chromate transporter
MEPRMGETTQITPQQSLSDAPRRVPVADLIRYFLRLGALGFGGPVALCGQMERELVNEKGWLTKTEMREAIAVSQSMPGPLAIQVGIFAAYMRGGFWGAWAGGWAFIFPNFVIVALLGALYVHFGDLPWMTGVFYGVAPVVIALILHSSSCTPAGAWRRWAWTTGCSGRSRQAPSSSRWC